MEKIFYTKSQLVALFVQFILLFAVAAAWEYFAGGFSIIILLVLCTIPVLTAIYQHSEEHVYWDLGNITRWVLINCFGNLILLIPTSIIAVLLF